MNQYDRENLNFLLSASRQQLEEWYNSIDHEDLHYAIGLLDKFEKELDIRHSMFEDSVEDFTDSIEILKNFRLNSEKNG